MIDTEQMIAMAHELVKRKWKIQKIEDEDDIVIYLADGEYSNLGEIAFEEDGDFIANAPATIVALAEQLERMKVGKDTLILIAFGYWQELEALKAKLAALKASLAEGQPHD